MAISAFKFWYRCVVKYTVQNANPSLGHWLIFNPSSPLGGLLHRNRVTFKAQHKFLIHSKMNMGWFWSILQQSFNQKNDLKYPQGGYLNFISYLAVKRQATYEIEV